jgi:hypothetical protein
MPIRGSLLTISLSPNKWNNPRSIGLKKQNSWKVY